jgi:hypothetical protein
MIPDEITEAVLDEWIGRANMSSTWYAQMLILAVVEIRRLRAELRRVQTPWVRPFKAPT